LLGREARRGNHRAPRGWKTRPAIVTFVLVLASVGVWRMVAPVDTVVAASARHGTEPTAVRSLQAPGVPVHSAQVKPAAQSVQVRYDWSRIYEGAPEDPCAACKISQSAPMMSPPWNTWVSLAGTRLAASSSSETVNSFAARIPHGTALLIANHGTEKATIDVSVRLPRGVYTIEQLNFDAKMPETTPRLERLESVVMGGAGSTTKPVWLLPEKATVLRFINRSAQTQSDFDEVMDAVRSFSSTRASEFRLLMVPLRECESNVGALSRGIQPGKRYDALRYIHRALLTLGHAQSLCRNFRGQGRIKGEASIALADALTRLDSTLTEMSAGCLNLVPAFVVTAPDAAHPALSEVVVSLRNAGGQSVTFVRLGASLPAGGVVQPSDPAFFEVLKPGETVRAVYKVRSKDAPQPAIVAEIGWFAAKAPAQMHLRTLSGETPPTTGMF
jgi:hypothetical protein